MKNKIFSCFQLALTVFCLLPLLTLAQTQKSSLFAAVDQARATAEAAESALLSPKIFAQAVAEYDDAYRDFEKGKDTERVQREIAEAETLFRKASENAEIARLTMRDEIESRDAAIAARADRLVPQEMAAAEALFSRSAATLEKGNLKGAQEIGERANEALRLAELNAIRAEHLNDARILLAQARDAKTDRSAPRTAAKAEDLLAQADALLVADRYDTAPAIELARQAAYEARHALHIGSLADRVRDKELTTEDVILDWESALVDITDALELNSDLSDGYAFNRDGIISYARELMEMRSVVTEQNIAITGLEEEIRELDVTLGGASADRTALIQQVERQARIREQFSQVADAFDPDEAIVLRDGDNLILRLVGVRFASNSADLDPSFKPLMTKVDAAIAIFPQCTLSVEGHTDSTGEVGRNQDLSVMRAKVIMEYMIRTLQIPAFRIRAIGYGDTRPITSNRTDEGRAQNRRIDLVITPQPDSL